MKEFLTVIHVTDTSPGRTLNIGSIFTTYLLHRGPLLDPAFFKSEDRPGPGSLGHAAADVLTSLSKKRIYLGLIAMTNGQTTAADLAYAPSPDVSFAIASVEVDAERVEGQAKASLLHKVQHLLQNYPERSLRVIRGWMHESTYH